MGFRVSGLGVQGIGFGIWRLGGLSFVSGEVRGGGRLEVEARVKKVHRRNRGLGLFSAGSSPIVPSPCGRRLGFFESRLQG